MIHALGSNSGNYLHSKKFSLHFSGNIAILNISIGECSGNYILSVYCSSIVLSILHVLTYFNIILTHVFYMY